MTEPMITCPKCKKAIKPTGSFEIPIVNQSTIYHSKSKNKEGGLLIWQR